MAAEHLAAIIPSKGSELEIVSRPTPTPGPEEVLIEVHAIALNPIDVYSQSMGFMIDSYPAVIGSDVGGAVLSVGSSVPTSTDIKPGQRVAALAPSFVRKGAPDYGAFQKRVIVPYQAVTLLPDSISFTEAAVLPLSVMTAWFGLNTVSVSISTSHSPEDKKGFLLWSASGSVGTAVLQVAKSMGFYVYATASSKHHEYLKTLGAHRLFDYNDPDVTAKIIQAVRGDGVDVEAGYLASGDLDLATSIVEKLRGDNQTPAKFACATTAKELEWWAKNPTYRGMIVKFAKLPDDVKERTAFSRFVFGEWLKEKLGSGAYVPSPKAKELLGGLEGIQAGLDELKQSVSGVKLVVKL
ncbi:zinc-binding oxidoreductase-like protein CipB [Cladochytrium replicatum]|nr:zinc-binding oxidoreductase-like protein CipB [Cladochytrium replicatum]